MISYIWSAIAIISVVFSVFSGKASELTSAVFSGAESSIMLCISLCGCICFFSGIMEVASKSGIVNAVSKLLTPIIKLIFPKMDSSSEEAGAIAMNMTANMLGLGNAATPFGLKAMSILHEKSGFSDTASDYMITFVVINTASIQILPTTVAMLRTKAGSTSPLDIMPCVWVASFLAVFLAVCVANLLNYISKRPLKSTENRCCKT